MNKKVNLKILICLVLIFKIFSNAQEISWNSHKFGAVCCINETWIKSIQSFSNGDVCLMLDYISPAGSFLRSTDNGKSWDNNLGEYNIYSAAEYSGKFLLSNFTFQPAGSQIFLADSLTDSIKFWKKLDSGFISQAPVRSFAINSDNDIFAATEFRWFDEYSSRIFYLEEENSTWEERNEGLPDSIEITTIIVTDNNVVLIGSLKHGIYRTINNGSLWSRVNIGNDVFSIKSLKENNKGHVFAATDMGVLLSKDDGASWNFINTGLPATGVYSIAINNENNLYTIGKDDILYYSNNYGNLWQPIQNTPALGSFFKDHFLEINSKGYLFLTNMNIIYVSNNPVTNVSDEGIASNRSSYILLQNYPNPFNPVTKIKYQIEMPGHVSLKVYDLLGNLAAVLVDEQKPAGQNEVEFNAGNFASGIYFYQLKADHYFETKKMVLIK